MAPPADDETNDDQAPLPVGHLELRVPALGIMRRLAIPTAMTIRQGGSRVIDFRPTTPHSGIDPALFARYWGDDPWFLGELPAPMADALLQAGMDRAYLEGASKGLGLAYPPDVCTELSKTDEGRSLIVGLYEPNLTPLVPLLIAGADLQDCRPAPSATVLTNLRSARAFSGARREAWVHARLSNAGLDVSPEPSTDQGKRPDFRVTAGADDCYVEVKTNPLSEAEAVMQRVRQEVAMAVNDCHHPSRFVWVRGTSILGQMFLLPDADAVVTAALPNILHRCDQLLDAVRKASFAVRDYGGDLLEFRVSDTPESRFGHIAVDLWAGLPMKKFVGRVLRKIREANQQVPRHGRGIVVVDLGNVNRIDVLSEALLFEARAKPSDFDRIECAVAVISSSSPSLVRRQVTVPLPLRLPATISPFGRRVVEAILGRRIGVHPTGTPDRSNHSPDEFGADTVFLVPLDAETAPR